MIYIFSTQHLQHNNKYCLSDILPNFCDTITYFPELTRLTILFPPLINIVTAREFWHSSITNILSLVVPKESSLTIPALPNFSVVNSSNLGTILPPVAMAINWNICKTILILYTLEFYTILEILRK